MPSTRIATGEWARGRETALIEAVQSALSTALQIPDWDRDIVLDCHAEGQRIIPAARSQRFTRIEIMLFEGRSLEAKRNLYRAIVDKLGATGVPSVDIKITLIEIAPENWGVRGGVPASEVDLGFKIDV